MLRDYAASRPEVGVCVVRPCIVLGPTVANYIAVNLLNQPVASLIDGADLPFQFIHEDDLARLITICLERRATGVFNAVGAGEISSREIASRQGKRALRVPGRLAVGVLWAVRRLKLLPYAMPPGVLDFYRYPWIASGDKARRELGFEPAHTTANCFDAILGRKDEILEDHRRRMAARGRR
jgi:nucleoside-diphosphate-sugar epimerase